MNYHPILKSVFGFDTLRPSQIPVIDSILSHSDTLAIMPTGGGKSLCYQLPALMFDGVTVVISPLIALMIDQVAALRKNGVPACYINSSQSEGEQREFMDQIRGGDIKILYVSPEKVLSGGGVFLDFLASLQVSLFAIDESHCVSQWGHDFRPEYAQLGVIKRRFPHVPLIALTATADKLTRDDIIDRLGIEGCNIYISSFDRPNIRYTVAAKDDGYTQLQNFVNTWTGESGIVYCLSRKSTEEVAKKLTSFGIPARAFHAGLSTETKQETYDDFMQDRLQVVVATIAFGMGIDKPDVRFVVHWNLPKTIENYYQETGRAGRDGLQSEAFLLFDAGDSVMLRSFIQKGSKPAHFQTKESQIFDKIQYDKLDRLIDFCQTGQCRRRVLLQYFEERRDKDCGNCDCCLNPKDTIDGLIIAQKIISAIARTGERFGANYILDVLIGADNEKITQNKHNELPTFGVGKDKSKKEWSSYINQLIGIGLIEVVYDGFIKTLALNEESKKVLSGYIDVNLIEYVEVVKAEKQVRVVHQNTDLSASENKLFEKLRTIRTGLAAQEKVPTFLIFSNATLVDMAQKQPKTFDEFGEVSGVGKQKQAKYWKEFVRAFER